MHKWISAIFVDAENQFLLVHKSGVNISKSAKWTALQAFEVVFLKNQF
jgi:hypothetical protein